MLKNKTWGLFAVAIILAVVASWASISYLDTKEANMRASLLNDSEKIEIIVAAFDLNPGDQVSADNMVLREVPSDYLPDGFIYPDEFELIDGMQLSVPMTGGRPLIRNNLVGANGVQKFSELLKKGERSITLKIDGMQSDQGMLKAGDYIDIVLKISTNQKKEESDEKTTSNTASLTDIYNVVLERIVVLATGTKTIADANQYYAQPDPYSTDNDYETITIGVGVDEISKVMAAVKFEDAGMGKILYLLRNPEDEEKVKYKSLQQMQANIIQTYSGGSGANGKLSVAYTTVESNAVSAVFTDGGSSRKFRKYKSTPKSFMNASRESSPKVTDAN